MKEKIEIIEVEAERIELSDLGDATEETRQYHPLQQILDSALQYGRGFGE